MIYLAVIFFFSSEQASRFLNATRPYVRKREPLEIPGARRVVLFVSLSQDAIYISAIMLTLINEKIKSK